jgi:hypothetical protein
MTAPMLAAHRRARRRPRIAAAAAWLFAFLMLVGRALQKWRVGISLPSCCCCAALILPPPRAAQRAGAAAGVIYNKLVAAVMFLLFVYENCGDLRTYTTETGCGSDGACAVRACARRRFFFSRARAVLFGVQHRLFTAAPLLT